MDSFDDIQIEDFSSFDFVEEMNEGIFEAEEDDDKSFNTLLNSNIDFWWLLSIIGPQNWILQQIVVLKNLRVMVLKLTLKLMKDAN